jgi:hypothetical protein
VPKELRVSWPVSPPFPLEQVCRLGRQSIGSRHPSADALESRLSANPKCLAVGSIGVVVQAYSLVYLLSDQGTDSLMTGAVAGISGLPISDFSTETTAASLYVGMVGALPEHRLLAIRLLVWQVAGLLRDADKVDWVLGRIATNQGGRLLARVGGQPVGEGMFGVEADALRSQLSQDFPAGIPEIKRVAAAFRRDA